MPASSAFQQVADDTLVAVLFGPPHIHAHQHLCPVLCLGAAGSRVDFQHGVHGVFLLPEHILQLQVLDGIDGFCIYVVHLFLGDELFLVEVEGRGELIGERLHLVVALDPFLQALDLLHLLLGALGIFPEVGCLRADLLLFIFHLLAGNVEVFVERLNALLGFLQLFWCNHASYYVSIEIYASILTHAYMASICSL